MERFGAVYEDFQKARLGCEEAALILGCSVRHFLRLRERYDESGVEALRDGRVGRVSQRRAADVEVARVTQLYRERYAGFNVRHFHEFAVREHGVMRGYSWTRTSLRQKATAWQECLRGLGWLCPARAPWQACQTPSGWRATPACP